MKYIILLGDGMSDQPQAECDGKTPLMLANTPYMDRLAALGRSGTLKTIPDSLHPGSEVANLAVLGYDVESVYEGRGVIEAASIGVELQEGDLAMRCNLVTLTGDIILNHSAGHISTEEADILIGYLNEHLGSDSVQFYTGVSYRHLLVIKGGNKHLICTPPHDVPGKEFLPLLPKEASPEGKETAQLLNDLIRRSYELLQNHPVNLTRKSLGKEPANSIWPWSPGHKPNMKSLKELFGIQKGAVISAVDLIQGIGVYAGLDVIKVEGATGLYDTNFEGKAEAAVKALEDHDFVYLHVEASDEAGHEGDLDLKVRTIEYLDQRVLKCLMEECSKMEEPVSIALLPDVQQQQAELYQAQLRPMAFGVPLRQRPVQRRRPDIIRRLEMHLVQPRLHVGGGLRNLVLTGRQRRKRRLRLAQPRLCHRLVVHRHHCLGKVRLARGRALGLVEPDMGVAHEVVRHELPRRRSVIGHRRRRPGEGQQRQTQPRAAPAAPLGVRGKHTAIVELPRSTTRTTCAGKEFSGGYHGTFGSHKTHRSHHRRPQRIPRSSHVCSPAMISCARS